LFSGRPAEAGRVPPLHYHNLLTKAKGHFRAVIVDGHPLDVCRSKETIWGEQKTVLLFVSERLKAGQLRGIYKSLEKKPAQLDILLEE